MRVLQEKIVDLSEMVREIDDLLFAASGRDSWEAGEAVRLAAACEHAKDVQVLLADAVRVMEGLRQEAVSFVVDMID